MFAEVHDCRGDHYHRVSVTDRLIRPDPSDVLQNRAADSGAATADVHDCLVFIFIPTVD